MKSRAFWHIRPGPLGTTRLLSEDHKQFHHRKRDNACTSLHKRYHWRIINYSTINPKANGISSSPNTSEMKKKLIHPIFYDK